MSKAKGKPPGLLVSVVSAEEAEVALNAGVDLIDVKDPSRGPLGMAHHETVAAVLVVLGGSLKLEQVKLLKDVGADWLAVRGGVCAGNQREGMLDAVRIKKWKEALKA